VTCRYIPVFISIKYLLQLTADYLATMSNAVYHKRIIRDDHGLLMTERDVRSRPMGESTWLLTQQASPLHHVTAWRD